MKHGQIFQGILFFLALFISGTCMCAGRFGLAPLKGSDDVQAWVQKTPGSYWIEGEDRILFYLPQADAKQLPGGPRTVVLESNRDRSWIYFLYGAGPLPAKSRELLRGGRVRVIESAVILDTTGDDHRLIRPMIPNHRLVKSLAYAPDPLLRSSSLAAAVDGETWRNEVDELSRFSRFTYGTDIERAKNWISSRFSAIPGLKVQEQEFNAPKGRATNIVATLKGRSRPEELYIIGAHYDSISEKPMESAPGAEDNASGTAGVLALARIFAEQPPEATLIFVAFSGEEQGLLGSRSWVKDLQAEGLTQKVHGVFIMDMIGYSGDEELDCLLESSPATRPFLDQIQAAHIDRDLVLSESLDYWGSDHVPFLDNSIPAVLFIENDYLDYPAYHRSGDTLEKIHPTLGPKVLTLIADSLGSLAY